MQYREPSRCQRTRPLTASSAHSPWFQSVTKTWPSMTAGALHTPPGAAKRQRHAPVRASRAKQGPREALTYTVPSQTTGEQSNSPPRYRKRQGRNPSGTAPCGYTPARSGPPSSFTAVGAMPRPSRRTAERRPPRTRADPRPGSPPLPHLQLHYPCSPLGARPCQARHFHVPLKPVEKLFEEAPARPMTDAECLRRHTGSPAPLSCCPARSPAVPAARCSSPTARPRPERRHWTCARRPAGPGSPTVGLRRSSRRTPGCWRTRSPHPRTEDLNGWTLHRLRHSALTHDAEDGTSTPMLLARSRHASVRSLERYARPGVDAVARHVAGRDPAAYWARTWSSSRPGLGWYGLRDARLGRSAGRRL